MGEPTFEGCRETLEQLHKSSGSSWRSIGDYIDVPQYSRRGAERCFPQSWQTRPKHGDNPSARQRIVELRTTCKGANEAIYSLLKRQSRLSTVVTVPIHQISSASTASIIETISTASIDLSSDLLCLQFETLFGRPHAVSESICETHIQGGLPQLRGVRNIAVEYFPWLYYCENSCSMCEQGPQRVDYSRDRLASPHDDSHTNEKWESHLTVLWPNNLPRLETLYLIDYSIELLPGRAPWRSSRRFPGHRYDFVEVQEGDRAWFHLVPTKRTTPPVFDFATALEHKFFHKWTAVAESSAQAVIVPDADSYRSVCAAIVTKHIRVRVMACVPHKLSRQSELVVQSHEQGA